MNRLLIAAVLTMTFGCFSSQARAADAYDALLAGIDYLDADHAVMSDLVEIMNGGGFDLMDDAAQAGYDYASAMAPPPPYDDGSVEMAVTSALDGMTAASGSLAAAMQARLDALDAAIAGLNYEANGQYDDAVAAYQAATWDDPMGFGIFQMDIWALADSVADAQYWLANWPDPPPMP